MSLLAEAHRRRDAEMMLRFMTAAQGDNKSWKQQQKLLRDILKKNG